MLFEMNPTKSLCRIFLLAILFFAGQNAEAQNPRGGLRGTVVDGSGARVPGARIVARNPEQSFSRETQTNGEGEFLLVDLSPGLYEVAVSASGFSDSVSTVEVLVSSVRELRIKLLPKQLQQVVMAKGQEGSITTQVLDTSSAVHQAIIYWKDLDEIPLAARSFANIAYLAPGIEPVEPSDPTKARITAVSTGGSSGLNNEVSVDGGDNSDDYIGGFLQNLSPDAIREFAFRTAQADADTGRTTAGSVMIITHSGTNDWHGGFSLYERDAALNARFPIDNPAPNPKQPFSRQNYVGTLGGPVMKDRLWVFSSLEYVHENTSIAYSPASLGEFDALAQLATMGLLPGVPSIAVPNDVDVPFRDYLATFRVNWNQSERSNWFLRAAADTYTMRNALVQQGALPSTGATSHNNYFNVVLGQQSVFSSSWMGSLVLEASTLHLTQSRNDNLGFAFALRRLVKRELDPVVPVRHHFGHEGRVFGRDVLIVEVLIERKAHHRGVKIYPTVHLVPAHVPDYVVHMQQPCGTRQVVVRFANVSG